MKNSECDITEYALLDSESVGMTFIHIPTLEHFRCHVVEPSLKALTDKLDGLRVSDNSAWVFLAGDMEDLMKRTIEAYLLALQSMWERGLRAMLANCEAKICNGKALNAIKTATWSGKSGNLQEHFLRLMGISIRSFSSFNDLDFLQTLGNAIRHGDGNSARRLYQLTPSFWPGMLESDDVVPLISMSIDTSTSRSYVPQFDQINIPAVVLEQMMISVLWFWEDIENVRCNSFKRKHDNVVRQLSTWKTDINQRDSKRVWTWE